MRITFILPGYPWKPVGGYRVVYEYANHLAARGHDVFVVHARHLPNWPPSPPPNLYRRLRRKAGQIKDLIFKPRIHWQPIDHHVKLLYVPEPTARYVPDADVVFATWWATAELVLDYPSSKGHKFYLIQSYEIWGGPKERVDATWKAPLKKIVIAKWLYEKGLELGVPPEEMIYIPNGINHEIFRLEKPIENRPPRVAMMFSNAEWKGGPDGIKALELAREKFPNLQAILFGVGPRPIGLPKWIEYVKNPSQKYLVERIYNGSSIYLCPSHTEGFSLPPAEATASGCAVVATNSGGILEYAEHGRNALLSPPRDPEALAKNLMQLLENDDLRIKLAKEGHKRIKEYTWDKVQIYVSIHLFEKVYRGCIPFRA